MNFERSTKIVGEIMDMHDTICVFHRYDVRKIDHLSFYRTS